MAGRGSARRPSDADPIEVGILIVGAGPAGLACAIRLGQLLEEDPETAERLGDVPVAVLEKGKRPGSHLLSGAVLNPRGAAAAVQRQQALRRACRSTTGRHESVYFLTRSVRADPGAADDAEPRELHRLALPARPVPRRRGGGGRSDDPPRDARDEAARRRRPRARRPHRRPRPRPERRGARQLRAGLGHPRPHHRPGRGDAGTPDRRGDRAVRPPGREPAGLGARRQGGLEGREAARPRRSTRWAGRCARARSTASSAARSSTRWARTWSRSAWSSASTTATPSCPSTTCSRS